MLYASLLARKVGLKVDSTQKRMLKGLCTTSAIGNSRVLNTTLKRFSKYDMSWHELKHKEKMMLQRSFKPPHDTAMPASIALPEAVPTQLAKLDCHIRIHLACR